MSEQDQILKNLFEPDRQTEASLQDDGFTASVMVNIQQTKRRQIVWKICSLMAVVLLAVTMTIQLGFTEYVTLSLTAPLVSLGEGWVSWVLSPINNIGALLVALVKIIHRISGRKSEWRGSLLPF